MSETAPIRGETTIKLGEHDYKLVPDYDRLCKAETDVGERIMPFAARLERGDIGMRDFVTLLFRCGQGVEGNPKLTFVQLGELAQAHGLVALSVPMVKMLQEALMGDTQPPEA